MFLMPKFFFNFLVSVLSLEFFEFSKNLSIPPFFSTVLIPLEVTLSFIFLPKISEKKEVF